MRYIHKCRSSATQYWISRLSHNAKSSKMPDIFAAFSGSPRRADVISSNWHHGMQRCDLPLSRNSRLNGKNLGPTFWTWAIFWGTAPKEGEDLSGPSGADMYYHAKSHADRCHRRRDM